MKADLAPPRTVQGKSLLSANMASNGLNTSKSNLGTFWTPYILPATGAT